MKKRKNLFSRIIGLLFGRKKGKGYRKGTEFDPDCYDVDFFVHASDPPPRPKIKPEKIGNSL